MVETQKRGIWVEAQNSTENDSSISVLLEAAALSLSKRLLSYFILSFNH
jgi:hypothetical protein